MRKIFKIHSSFNTNNDKVFSEISLDINKVSIITRPLIDKELI